MLRPDSEVVPLDQFPYNFYDVLEPEIDFEHWALTVGGWVAKPGKYTLGSDSRAAKVTQNTRHVCVEGWDVIGQFGGARLARLLGWIGAESVGALSHDDLRGRLLRVARHRDRAAAAVAPLL